MSDPLDTVVEALVSAGRKVKNLPSGLMAQCPAHDDRTPSLSITAGQDGRALLHCHAGCDTDDILAALGMNVVSLFPDDGQPRTPDLSMWPGYRKAVGQLVPATPRPATVPHERPEPAKAVTDVYVYDDAAGKPVARVVRYTLTDPGSGEIVGKTFRQHAADDNGGWKSSLDGYEPPLYHLPAVLSAKSAGLPIVVVEGEKDADTAADLGFVGTCNPMGAGKWRPHHTEVLAGAAVMLIPDRDSVGVAHARTVRDALLLAGARVTVYGTLDGKDLSDHHAAGKTFADLVPVDLDDTDAWLEGRGADEPARTSWWPRNLEPVLTGAHDEALPTHLERADGSRLFYAGKVNGLLGESESGKTWVALLAVVQSLAAGEVVLYLDFEDTAPGIVSRLRALGSTDEDLRGLHYVGPEESLHLAASNDLRDALEQLTPTLVVLDGFNAAMTLLGLDLDNNKDATQFAQVLLRPLAATGACVVYVDHVPKNKDNRGKGGIGAQAKRAMTTGCALSVDVLAPFGRGMTGRLKLTVDKDRPGHVRAVSEAAKHVGVAVLESDADTLAVTVRIQPQDGEEAGRAGDAARWQLMERLSQWLFEAPESTSKTAAAAAMKVRAEPVREALDALVDAGYVRRDGHSHVLERTFSVADMLLSEPTRPPVPTPSQPVPDGGARQAGNPVRPSHPLRWDGGRDPSSGTVNKQTGEITPDGVDR